ncbi:MAG: hypothetical protein M3235_19200, partial [Actinomycetota bacterium]|nr:hypothetical protein [Actinomycetota bacterium]
GGAAPAQGGAPSPTQASPAAPGQAGGSQAQQAAAAEIRSALNQLKAAQQSGDFAKQGEALAALDAAVNKFQSAGG